MKTLLLLRHAEREDIPENVVGNEVLLTPQGEQDCLNFALRLKQKVISIKSSPVLRCQQTAKLIAISTEYPTDKIFRSSLLGEPGFIIENGDIAWHHWQKKGHDAVNQYLLTGSGHWEGFSNLNRAVDQISNIIRLELQQSKIGTHVWITHDTILATYASRVLPQPLSLGEWPDFLSYLKVQLLDNDTLGFTYEANHLGSFVII